MRTVHPVGAKEPILDKKKGIPSGMPFNIKEKEILLINLSQTWFSLNHHLS